MIIERLINLDNIMNASLVNISGTPMVWFFVDESFFYSFILISILIFFISGFCFFKTKNTLGSIFLILGFFIFIGNGILVLKGVVPTNKMLINEIIKEKSMITEEELNNLSYRSLYKILLKIKIEKEEDTFRRTERKI